MHDLWLASMKTPNFRCTVVPLSKPRNWPSETTLNTNRLNGSPVGSFGFSINRPAARRSPTRLKEAVTWWFARAETRRIIERMMQP